MKRTLLAFVPVLLVVGLVFGQGVSNPPGSRTWRKYSEPYDGKTAPPLGLADAYVLTLNYIGSNSNKYHCVAANCLDKTRSGLPGWTFCYMDTNGERAYLHVLFDKDIYVDPRTAESLKGK
jgi:hypothetical protein